MIVTISRRQFCFKQARNIQMNIPISLVIFSSISFNPQCFRFANLFGCSPYHWRVACCKQSRNNGTVTTNRPFSILLILKNICFYLFFLYCFHLAFRKYATYNKINPTLSQRISSINAQFLYGIQTAAWKELR